MPGTASIDDGVTGAYSGDLATKVTIATFLGIAWYNAIELFVLIFVAFNRYRGLYFWSLLLSAALGVVPYAIGFLIKFFELMDSIWLSLVLLSLGWWVMITGQAIVLYSRLHLVVRDQRILRRVLYMIIIDVFLFHVPTTILTFGSNAPATSARFVPAYKIMEKIQMSGFCLQEFIISSLYIWETIKLLRLSPDHGNRKIMYQLLGINMIFIIMDLGLLGCAYATLYVYETTVKATIYSIKLKLEFAVLGKLVHFVNHHSWDPGYATGPNGFPDFVDASRITTDVTRAPQCAKGPPKPPWSLPDELNDPNLDMSEGSEGKNSDFHASHSENGGSVSVATRTDSVTANTPVDVTHHVPRQRTSNPDYAEWPS